MIKDDTNYLNPRLEAVSEKLGKDDAVSLAIHYSNLRTEGLTIEETVERLNVYIGSISSETVRETAREFVKEIIEEERLIQEGNA